MERKTLKFLRLLIPGLILIIEFLPMLKFLKVNFKIGDEWFDYSFLIIPALIIGSIYHMFEIRFIVTNISHRKIDLNITNSLIKIYKKTITQEQHNFLKAKRLKHIFYNIVDNDPSLTAKSELVYLNGILWTSTADIFLLSIIISLIYLISSFFVCLSTSLLIYSLLFGGIAVLSFCFHLLSIIRHYKLSNEQIEYIETHYQVELIMKIDKCIEEMN